MICVPINDQRFKALVIILLGMTKPNILIIYTDQQRYDTLGCNGNDLIKTPHIDALAASGTNISDCHVSCPICVPSRVALFTGQWGIKTGSIDNSPESQMRTDNVNMMQHFKAYGYRTALIGKNHCFLQNLRDDCFDVQITAGHMGMSEARNELETEMMRQREYTMQSPMAEEHTPASASITNHLTEHCIDYLQDDNDQPFCCWLSIPDPHPPYMVCEPYRSMYNDVDVPGPVWRAGEMDNKPRRQQIAVEIDRLSGQYPADEDIITLRRIYWGMVSQIDDGIGRIMETLRTTGKDKNTIIIFTSDHGDYMGDHRLIRKGVDCYSATTHVPMLWSWPGHIAAAQRDVRISNIDIFPSLCELADVPPPPSVQGISHAALLRGETHHGREFIFSHHGRPGEPMQDIPDTKRDELIHHPNDNFLLTDAWFRGRCFAIRNDNWSYMYTPGDVDELYDRHEDPHELFNIADQKEHAETVATLRSHLLTWLSECLVSHAV